MLVVTKNLVACSTEMSAGLAPLSILSTKNGGAAIHFEKIHSVADQAARFSEFIESSRGEPLLCRKISNCSCVADEYRVLQDHERSSPPAARAPRAAMTPPHRREV